MNTPAFLFAWVTKALRRLWWSFRHQMAFSVETVDREHFIVYRRITIEGGRKSCAGYLRMRPMGDTQIDADTFARICKALAHPARVRIVRHLKTIDQCICEIPQDCLHNISHQSY